MKKETVQNTDIMRPSTNGRIYDKDIRKQKLMANQESKKKQKKQDILINSSENLVINIQGREPKTKQFKYIEGIFFDFYFKRPLFYNILIYRTSLLYGKRVGIPNIKKKQQHALVMHH